MASAVPVVPLGGTSWDFICGFSSCWPPATGTLPAPQMLMLLICLGDFCSVSVGPSMTWSLSPLLPSSLFSCFVAFIALYLTVSCSSDHISSSTHACETVAAVTWGSSAGWKLLSPGRVQVTSQAGPVVRVTVRASLGLMRVPSVSCATSGAPSWAPLFHGVFSAARLRGVENAAVALL